MRAELERARAGRDRVGSWVAKDRAVTELGRER
jgi:hypothetical protein